MARFCGAHTHEDRVARFCTTHKEEGHVNVKDTRCEAPCGSEAVDLTCFCKPHSRDVDVLLPLVEAAVRGARLRRRGAALQGSRAGRRCAQRRRRGRTLPTRPTATRAAETVRCVDVGVTFIRTTGLRLRCSLREGRLAQRRRRRRRSKARKSGEDGRKQNVKAVGGSKAIDRGCAAPPPLGCATMPYTQEHSYSEGIRPELARSASRIANPPRQAAGSRQQPPPPPTRPFGCPPRGWVLRGSPDPRKHCPDL